MVKNQSSTIYFNVIKMILLTHIHQLTKAENRIHESNEFNSDNVYSKNSLDKNENQEKEFCKYKIYANNTMNDGNKNVSNYENQFNDDYVNSEMDDSEDLSNYENQFSDDHEDSKADDAPNAQEDNHEERGEQSKISFSPSNSFDTLS